MSTPPPDQSPPPHATGHREHTPPPGSPDDWLRLDPRTVPARAIIVCGALLAAAAPTTIGLLLAGIGIGWALLWCVVGIVLGTAGIAVAEAVRLAVTRYRVGPHRVDRRVRFLSSTTTSISTGRVRNVEISADVVQRRMGIATVKLASGESDGTRLVIDALDRDTAEDLRARVTADRTGSETSQLVRLDPAWVRYAPASLMTPVFGIVGIALVFQVASWFNAVPAMLDWVWDRIGTLPWPVIGLGVLVLAMVIGTISSVAVFVESWWGLSLDRHSDRSLELRRGLLVGRHTSFDGTRIRGITLHEPPGFRWLGAARLDVVATGVGTGSEQNGQQRQSPALVPASPREVPAGVAAEVVGAPVPDRLRGHPPAARRRRGVRALAAAVALTVVALVPALIWPWLWWVSVLVLLVSGGLSAWIAVDNYRGLGHRVDGTVVALRKGSVLRRTDVLITDGILGWNLRRTPFQRRAGLVTMIATSAGGTGAFRLPDVDATATGPLRDTAGTVWDHLTVSPDDPAAPAR